MLNSYIISTFNNHNTKLNQDIQKQKIYFKVVENLKLITLKVKLALYLSHQVS